MDDYDALINLAERFKTLNIDEVGMVVREVVQDLIDDEFQGGYAPTGEPWPHNKSTPWFFDPNHSLRDSVSVVYGDKEIIISSEHVAFGYQVYGTMGGTRIQPHPIIPDDVGLTLWEPPIFRAIAAYFHMKLDDHGNPIKIKPPRKPRAPRTTPRSKMGRKLKDRSTAVKRSRLLDE